LFSKKDLQIQIIIENSIFLKEQLDNFEKFHFFKENWVGNFFSGNYERSTPHDAEGLVNPKVRAKNFGY
jgi:hypothetical protein